MAFIVSAAIFVFFHEGHSIYRARLLREILGGDCVGPCHDEDYVAIGIPYLLQARFAEAQQWFDRMCNPNPSMIGLRAIAIFGQGRIDEAFNEYRKSLNAAQANSAIDISVYMLGDSAILFHPDKHNLRLLIKEGIRLRIKDSTLFCAVRQYMILFGPASKEEIFNGADVPYKKYALSLTFLRVLSLIDAAETARKQYDEAQLESLAGEMKQISQRLARRRPKDLLDKVVLSALRLFIFHVFEDAECNASVYSELISETETHIMQLSEDIDRVKASAILDWLLAIFMHRPTLKAQLVGIMSTTIKKVEDANSRERFTRQLSIVLDTLTQAGQTVAPPA